VRRPTAAPIMLLAALSLGCVAEGGYYGAAPAYGVDYYGPYGYDYGAWGPSYLVAPYRDRDHDRGFDRDRRRAVERGREAPHAFRAAPAGRAVPSVPSVARPAAGGHPGGAARGGGGGHEGGGGHR
jgi:hypothetical protein